ncbi:MAG: DUF4293 family protein [Bacteroidetes bacterium]|jgi:Domain of unknown function (DUF4293)|nr:MAG: DUF4293 family protein [Bacteroidota bacterium]
MWQRIQTLYLTLAIVLNLLTLVLPLWRYDAGTQMEALSGLQTIAYVDPNSSQSMWFFSHPNSIKSAANTTFVLLVFAAAAVLTYGIFLYTKRPRQIQMAYAGLFILLGQTLSLVLATRQEPDFIGGATDVGRPEIGFLFIPVSIVLTWLALTRIRKDEELVRSVDRIR